MNEEIKPLEKQLPDDGWEIRGLEADTKKVTVLFRHNDHLLMHSLFVENLDKDEILKSIEEDYQKFQEDIENSAKKFTPIPEEVSRLIGFKIKK